MPDATPTPPTRRRTTRRSVYITDKVSTVVITLGGLVVVAAVLGIGIYLVGVTINLFLPGSIEERFDVTLPETTNETLFVEADEHQSTMLRLLDDGRLQTIELDTGELIAESDLVDGERFITAFARSPRGGNVALGLDDGSVQLGEITFFTEFLTPDDEPEELQDLEIGHMRKFGESVATRTPLNQLRLTSASVELADPITLRVGEGAVTLVDYHADAREEFLVAIREDGAAAFNKVRKIQSLMGGAPRIRLSEYSFPTTFDIATNAPQWVVVTGDGENALLIWPDGACQRYNTTDPDDITLAETTALVDTGRTVTAIAKVLGGHTIAVGDDAGNVYGYFASRNELADTPDGKVFVRAHTLEPQREAITSIGVSSRDRTIITGDAGGGAVVRNMTSNAFVVRHDVGPAIADARLMPKVDGVLLVDVDNHMHVLDMDPRHPEATVSSLFGKIWYEGDPAPSYTYQSSSGDDAAEAKYNLVPLIFGTLKATIYTMLISVPFGILAAIYTSEFLSPRIRTSIKPSIEMMASLPSVVLGFIAAMVLAPLVRDLLPGVLLAFVGIPFGVLLGAYVWHFVPVRYMNRATAGSRLIMIVGVTLIAGWASIAVGPLVERVLFQPSDNDVLVRAGGYEEAPRDQWPDWVATRASIGEKDVRLLRQAGLYYRNGEIVRPAGELSDPAIQEQIALHGYDDADIRAWLNGVIGGPWPGWFIIAFPAGAFVMTILVTRFVDPRIRAWDREHSPMAEAGIELVKFLATVALSAVAAALLASVLTGFGFDARDSIFGSFQQRNTLVVGIAMSVAVIPIIYTIADDAMTSVPDTLRSASLGAGATRWQTAVRVVMPVAMSGIFSACMIGLGRAAGETMIVLMATGNTPIMSWSVFDGLRTLSANIAVELPEAPKDATHYRVLFLCGLVLFAMTFIINTAAEIIRQRVRKRSASL